MTTLRLLAVLLLSAACAHTRTPRTVPSAPPAELLGQFRDDYGNTFQISAERFEQMPHGLFHIVEWNVAEQYFLAHNDSSNTNAPRQWTRVDWMPLDMPPYAWAFCFTAYRAESREAARASGPPNRAEPRRGCNGYPFSRMAPIRP